MINNVILLCSEITKGMKSYGPKAFVPIGSKNKQIPLIIKQINNTFRLYGPDVKIYVVIGFEHDKFIKILDQFYPDNKNVIKIYNSKYDQSNGAHGVVLALDLIENGNALIVQNGIVTNYYPKIYTESLLPIIKNNNKDESFNIGLTINNKKVEYVFYDLPNRWSEILYIKDSDIKIVKDIAYRHDMTQKFLFEFINILIDNNITFKPDLINSRDILKINNHKTKL